MAPPPPCPPASGTNEMYPSVTGAPSKVTVPETSCDLTPPQPVSASDKQSRKAHGTIFMADLGWETRVGKGNRHRTPHSRGRAVRRADNIATLRKRNRLAIEARGRGLPGGQINGVVNEP